MRRPAMVLLVSALLVGGCASGQQDDPLGGGERAAEAPQDPTEADGPEPHGDLACDDDTQAAIDRTIDAQLAAFAADDFAAALALASTAFQAGIELDEFRTLIRDQFPLVAEATGHTSSVCVTSNGQAQLLVDVTADGDRTQQLVYRLTREDDAWRIAGAVPAPAAALPSPI